MWLITLYSPPLNKPHVCYVTPGVNYFLSRVQMLLTVKPAYCAQTAMWTQKVERNRTLVHQVSSPLCPLVRISGSEMMVHHDVLIVVRVVLSHLPHS